MMRRGRSICRPDVTACRLTSQPLPTTQEFAALHDHARLPWRFFARLLACTIADLRRA